MRKKIRFKTKFIGPGYTREYLKVAVLSEENLENQIKIGQIQGFLEDDTFICTI